MPELTPDESRVIGVLIEKALTTPDQYPLTINAVVNGANQKNNRDPLTSIDDGDALSALIGLRNKGLVVQQDGPGQRVPKFKHRFTEGIGVGVREMVVLAELLLRGPQTLGEIRGRASRMQPLESLELVRSVVEGLMNRPEPLVKQVAPARGSRAERFAQLLCPDLHAISEEEEGVPAEQPLSEGAGAAMTLGERVRTLEAEVTTLRAALSKLAAEIGAADPLTPSPGTPGEGGGEGLRISSSPGTPEEGRNEGTAGDPA